MIADFYIVPYVAKRLYQDIVSYFDVRMYGRELAYDDPLSDCCRGRNNGRRVYDGGYSYIFVC